QDLRLEREVIRFRQEKFYSPSLHRTFQAPLPAGFAGQFGPDLRAFVLSEYFGANVSQPALHRLLGYAGIDISAGQLSQILTAQVLAYLTEQGLAAKCRTLLASWLAAVVWSEAELTARLATPTWAKLPALARKLLREGLALGAYRAQTAWHPVRILVVDDAPQW